MSNPIPFRFRFRFFELLESLFLESIPESKPKRFAKRIKRNLFSIHDSSSIRFQIWNRFFILRNRHSTILNFPRPYFSPECILSPFRSVHIISRAASLSPFPWAFSSFLLPSLSFCPQIGLGRHSTLLGATLTCCFEVLCCTRNLLYDPLFCSTFPGLQT